MKNKYLYLDDDIGTNSIPILLENNNSELQVDMTAPISFSNQVLELQENKYSGLIIDYRLDLKWNNKIKAQYRGTTLAQQIRALGSEGKIPEIPIVLCSTDERLKEFHKKDLSGDDLFDAQYTKEHIADNAKATSNELVSLSKGYKSITNLKEKINGKWDKMPDFLKLSDKDSQIIDQRILTYLHNNGRVMPSHFYVRFILNELINKSGVLIDEETLGARLGIDIKKSRDWNKLLVQISKCSYTGPFSDVWKRWWMQKISLWWNSLKGCPGTLTNLSAIQRVEFLKKTIGLKNIEIAQPIKKGYHTKFWSICLVHHKPLDPLDGVQIIGNSLYPWQETSYISLDAALKRLFVQKGLRIHPSEKSRLEEIKAALRKNG